MGNYGYISIVFVHYNNTTTWQNRNTHGIRMACEAINSITTLPLYNMVYNEARCQLDHNLNSSQTILLLNWLH